MLTAVGCYERPAPIGWRHGLHSGSAWYAAPAAAARATPDLFGSVFQQHHRTLHNHQHQQQQQQQHRQHQHHYPPAAAAFASLLQQASSVVAPAAAAVVPYFQPQTSNNPDDIEKPIGCGAFGVVWCVYACYWFLYNSDEFQGSKVESSFVRYLRYLDKYHEYQCLHTSSEEVSVYCGAIILQIIAR